MTSSDKSARSILEARDARQETLSRFLSLGHTTTVFLSLNIPGPDKTPPGAAALFDQAFAALSDAFGELVLSEKAADALGPYAIVALAMDPEAAKKRCIALEERFPAARLIDLDVYSGTGRQVDRTSLELPARACLVCQGRAVDCIRLKAHAPDEVLAKTHELLACL